MHLLVTIPEAFVFNTKPGIVFKSQWIGWWELQEMLFGSSNQWIPSDSIPKKSWDLMGSNIINQWICIPSESISQLKHQSSDKFIPKQICAKNPTPPVGTVKSSSGSSLSRLERSCWRRQWMKKTIWRFKQGKLRFKQTWGYDRIYIADFLRARLNIFSC